MKRVGPCFPSFLLSTNILKNKLYYILKTNKEKTLSIVVRGRVKVSLSSCTLGMKLPQHRPGCGAKNTVAHNPYCIDIQEWSAKCYQFIPQLRFFGVHCIRRGADQNFQNF